MLELTDNQEIILEMLNSGNSTYEISKSLGITERVIKAQITRIRNKGYKIGHANISINDNYVVIDPSPKKESKKQESFSLEEYYKYKNSTMLIKLCGSIREAIKYIKSLD